MDKKELQQKLNKPYSTDNWREVVQFVFPNVQIFNPAQNIPTRIAYKSVFVKSVFLNIHIKIIL